MLSRGGFFHQYASWLSYRLRTPVAHLDERRARRVEARLRDRHGDEFEVDARCWICDQVTAMAVDYAYAYPVKGILTPNWRERLTCPKCGLNSRMRAAVHLLEAVLKMRPGLRLYLTEQNTPTGAVLRARYPDLEMSEFVDDTLESGGQTPDGVHHQDLTRLSFPDGRFDRVVSLDVLEHVPEFEQGLRECWRVLAPAGQLLLTVPFLIERRANLVRARVGPAGIEHLEPPEYHGDPLRPEGSLAYYHFGWELLAVMRRVGFARVQLLTWHSATYGYFGGNQVAVWATKRTLGL